MKTLEVKFNGEDYKVRNNMKARRLWAEAMKDELGVNELKSISLYAHSLLCGFNIDFKMSFDEFEMYIDDESNTDFLIAVNELGTELLDEMNVNKKVVGESDEKK